MTDVTFERDGLKLHLVDTGGPGLPVVFQHGLCGAAGQPAEVFPPDERFRRLTLECRGHGSSEAGPLDQLGIATFADDIAAMIEARVGAPVVLGGISMGAAIALRLAVRRPELVRALILARPAWVVDAAPANMRPNALVGELLAAYPPEEAARRFEASETARSLAVSAPDNLTSLRSFFGRTPLEVTSALLRRISADGPGISLDEISALDLPVLVIGHGHDEVHPLAHARNLAMHIKHSSLVEIVAKSVDRQRYVDDFMTSLRQFLAGT